MTKRLFFFTSVLVGVSALYPPFLTGQVRSLSPEGESRKAAHEYLFGEFSAGKELKFKGEGAARVLDEIVLSTERLELAGDVLLELPAGSQRVASMFRYLILRGEGLDDLEGLVMLPYAPKSNLAVSTQEPHVYRAGGLGGPLSGTFNGRPFKLKLVWANEFNNLFAPVRIPLTLDVLSETNTLKLAPKEGLTITSVHISTDRLKVAANPMRRAK